MPPSGTTTTPKIIELAERLIADIRLRRLKEGDRYLTTSEASKMLGVGNGVANRAMQLLERRQIITRQQRRGAFIAKLPGVGDLPPLRRVHFLVHQNYLTSEGVGSDLVLLGMQQELPGVHVQISFLPAVDAHGFVSQLIDQSLAVKAQDGLILVRAPFEVQQVVSYSGVPAIVYGGIYPGIARLIRFDRDMGAVGRIAADYLLQRGHKRIAFISRQQALPGDHDTMDGIRLCMGNKRLFADSLVERFLPAAPLAYATELRRLLQTDPRPTGFIIRSRTIADVAMTVFKEEGVKPGRGVDVVLCDYFLMPGAPPEYVFPRPAYSPEEQGRRMARMLAGLARGETVDNELIPVELDTTAAAARRR